MSCDPLIARIADEIKAGGPISFARFMELALYDPEQGYYSRAALPIGPEGDFVTASDSGRGLGRSMARQIEEIDRLLGSPDPFDIVEFGAGRGLLARDLTASLDTEAPDLSSRLRYWMVDRSAAMRNEARRDVDAARAIAPEQLVGRYRGCLLAVELLDALPVHRVRRRAGKLVELFVGLDGSSRLVECEGPPEPRVEALAERYGAAGEEGTEAEVSPLALQQLELMAAVLDQGVLILIDYGLPAIELYGPKRPRGTLLAYHKHTTNEDFLSRVGEQDLTAHVNFTALEERAREIGLELLGSTTQDRFLISTGILDAFADQEGESRHDARRVKQRMQALTLIHPGGMGRTFRVLLLSKGIARPPLLAGLRDPFR